MSTKWICLTRWAFVNGLFLVVVYAAVFHNHQPAENIITFVVWLFAILSISLFSKSAQEAVFNKDTAAFTYLPRWVDNIYDAIVIVLLIYPGWFATAAAYTFFCIVQDSSYKIWKERKEKKNEKDDSSR